MLILKEKFNKINIFLRRILNIYKKYNIRFANRLFFNYVKILIFNRFGNNDSINNFFNFKVYFPNKNTFFSQFIDIFIDNSYPIEKTLNNVLIIDCGSNIGISLLYFKLLCPNSRILCFEPNPESLYFLKKNIGINNLLDIEVYPYALSNKYSVEGFSVEESVKASTGASLYNNKDSEIEVEVKRLSNYICEDIYFLKVDIEGSEGELFDDLNSNNKLRYIRNISFEHHNNHINHYNNIENISNILINNDFNITKVQSCKDKTKVISCIRIDTNTP